MYMWCERSICLVVKKITKSMCILTPSPKHPRPQSLHVPPILLKNNSTTCSFYQTLWLVRYRCTWLSDLLLKDSWLTCLALAGQSTSIQSIPGHKAYLQRWHWRTVRGAGHRVTVHKTNLQGWTKKSQLKDLIDTPTVAAFSYNVAG